MSLLDLDKQEALEYSPRFTTEFSFLIGDIDLSTFDRLEQAAFSSVILITLFKLEIRSYPLILEFFNAFTITVQEECKKRLYYDILDYHPCVCANCFSYHGHTIGGDAMVYCGYCFSGYGNETKAKLWSRDSVLPGFLGSTSWLFPRTSTTEEYKQVMGWNTIFQARLIYNFFARSYLG
jgi:hypothetical protein